MVDVESNMEGSMDCDCGRGSMKIYLACLCALVGTQVLLQTLEVGTYLIVRKHWNVGLLHT